MKKRIILVICFCLLPYLPFKITSAAILGSNPNPQMQIHIQGTVTSNGEPLPTGTKIGYSFSIPRPIYMDEVSSDKYFTIDKTKGRYGPTTISIPSDTSSLNLVIVSVPQEYFGDQIFSGSNSLEFTITPDMSNETVTQDLSFKIYLKTSPPPKPKLGQSPVETPEPKPRATPTVPSPSKPASLAPTVTSTPILSSIPQQNPVQTPTLKPVPNSPTKTLIQKVQDNIKENTASNKKILELSTSTNIKKIAIVGTTTETLKQRNIWLRLMRWLGW